MLTRMLHVVKNIYQERVKSLEARNIKAVPFTSISLVHASFTL